MSEASWLAHNLHENHIPGRSSIDLVVTFIPLTERWEIDTSGIDEGFPPVIHLYHDDGSHNAFIITEVENALDYAEEQREAAESWKAAKERQIQLHGHDTIHCEEKYQEFSKRAKEAEDHDEDIRRIANTNQT